MLFIKEDPSKVEAFYKLINKSGLGDELHLISRGDDSAFLCVSPKGASAIAMPVTVQGDESFDRCCVVLTNGRKYLTKTISDEGPDITLEIPTIKNPDIGQSRYDPYLIRNSRGQGCPSYGSHTTLGQSYMFIHKTLMALDGDLDIVGKIRLPNRIGRGNGAVLDLLNRRYGICKADTDFHFLFSEVRDLTVEEGHVVACYYGKAAATLPWKKGLEAELYRFPGMGSYDFCVMRYLWNDLVILLMPANVNNDEINYVGVFGEDIPRECRCANEAAAF